MLQTTVVYRAFTFNIASEIPLPELVVIEGQVDADVIIEIGDLSAAWQEFGIPGKFTVKDHLVIFQIKNTATIVVQQGERVIVSPLKEFDEDRVRLYLLGTCMSILLMQRRILPLHGSAIAMDGKAYAFVGESGAGKSTLASVFLKKGYQLLSDDVIAVSLSEDGVPFVAPSYPQQKLWQDSLNQLGMEKDGFKQLQEREMKFSVPVSSQFLGQTLPLAGVFELEVTENSELTIYPITKLKSLDTLYRHTFRQFLIPRMGLQDWHFSSLAKVSHQINIFQLKRPKGEFTAEALSEIIRSQIQGGIEKNG